jgi:hypothetical protein
MRAVCRGVVQPPAAASGAGLPYPGDGVRPAHPRVARDVPEPGVGRRMDPAGCRSGRPTGSLRDSQLNHDDPP